MFEGSFLILSDESENFEFYKSLCDGCFKNINTILINETTTLNKFESKIIDLILIDLSNEKYIESLNNFVKKIKRAKCVLITSFEVNLYRKDIHHFNLILKKPINFDELKIFIKKETNKIEIEKFSEKKSSVLGKVVDLNPSEICIYTLDGILFYANSNYIKSNKLDLKSIDNITYTELNENKISFEMIKYKLLTNQMFVQQQKEKDNWYESMFYKVSDEFIIHICNNITDKKQRELQVEQYAVFFENSNEGIMIADKKMKILSVNNAFSKITGYKEKEIVGKKISILKSGIQGKDFYDEMWKCLKKNSSWQGEIWNKRKNGEIYPELLNIAKVLNPKYNEEFYMGIFTDISSLKEADKKLYFYANHDVLTKLANRAQFESYLKNSIESCKRKDTKLALLFIDVDKFKDINDTYGHAVGDEMLKSIAKRLEQSIRKEDFIARLGGDEFVLILKDVKNMNDILNLANKINENVKTKIEIDGKEFFMTLSIGISIFPEHGKNSEDLIKFADVAMYETKESGRNGATLYKEEMGEKVLEKLIIQNELRTAIQKDEFEMFYQSIVQTKNGDIIGAEALVRWNHKKRAILTPSNFINYIDEAGMSIEFGQLIIKKVLLDIQMINLKLGHNNFKVSINISPEHFFKFTFVEELIEYCKVYSIDPKQVELEILETHIMENSKVSSKKLEELNNIGFSMAIDDFGTGYSSLSYLKNFKVNKLKIDQSFIRDFLHDKSDKAIVEAIINLANIFKLKVQAEGVETKEHQQLLKDLKCDLAQGYYYCRPMPLSKFLQML